MEKTHTRAQTSTAWYHVGLTDATDASPITRVPTKGHHETAVQAQRTQGSSKFRKPHQNHNHHVTNNTWHRRIARPFPSAHLPRTATHSRSSSGVNSSGGRSPSASTSTSTSMMPDFLRRRRAGDYRLLRFGHHGHHRPILRRRGRLPIFRPPALVGHAADRRDHAPDRRRHALQAAGGRIGRIPSAAWLDDDLDILLETPVGRGCAIRFLQLYIMQREKEKSSIWNRKGGVE